MSTTLNNNEAISQALASFPWFATDILLSETLLNVVKTKQPLLNALAKHYDVNKRTIQACRNFRLTPPIGNEFVKLLQHINSLPIDYLPNKQAIEDQSVFFELVIPLSQLASTIGIPLQKLAKPFIGSWAKGLESLQNQTQQKLEVSMILNMMQSSYRYGFYPQLDTYGTAKREPSQKWYQQWFGNYGLKRLMQITQQWNSAYMAFAMKRMQLDEIGEYIAWDSLANKHHTIANYTIVELTSQYDLDTEGHALSHCIASYTQECLLGNSYLFSIRTKEGISLSTFEVIYSNNNTFEIKQHVAINHQKPSEKEVTLALKFVTGTLSVIHPAEIKKLTEKKHQLGQQYQDKLVACNSSALDYSENEIQTLANIVEVTYPAKVKAFGIRTFMEQNHYIYDQQKVEDFLIMIKQKHSIFSYQGREYRTNTIEKRDGTMLCFIHDKYKHYSESYYGTIFIKASGDFEYRNTKKSPTHTTQANKELQQLCSKIRKVMKPNKENLKLS